MLDLFKIENNAKKSRQCVKMLGNSKKAKECQSARKDRKRQENAGK